MQLKKFRIIAKDFVETILYQSVCFQEGANIEIYKNLILGDSVMGDFFHSSFHFVNFDIYTFLDLKETISLFCGIFSSIPVEILKTYNFCVKKP